MYISISLLPGRQNAKMPKREIRGSQLSLGFANWGSLAFELHMLLEAGGLTLICTMYVGVRALVQGQGHLYVVW